MIPGYVTFSRLTVDRRESNGWRPVRPPIWACLCRSCDGNLFPLRSANFAWPQQYCSICVSCAIRVRCPSGFPRISLTRFICCSRLRWTGGLSHRTLQRVASKCMSMMVAIGPAYLWTHAMFARLASMDKAGLSWVDLWPDSNIDLLREFKQWLSLVATSHEEPLQKARHLIVKLDGASDASMLGWGDAMNIVGTPYRAGGTFPADWLRQHINNKLMFSFYYLLRFLCVRFPTVLWWTQVLIDVDSSTVVRGLTAVVTRHRYPRAAGAAFRNVSRIQFSSVADVVTVGGQCRGGCHLAAFARVYYSS